MMRIKKRNIARWLVAITMCFVIALSIGACGHSSTTVDSEVPEEYEYQEKVLDIEQIERSSIENDTAEIKIFKGNLEPGKKVSYYFTPEYKGCYNIQFEGILNGEKICACLYDSTGERIGSPIVEGNGYGVYHYNLSVGETYEIYVDEDGYSGPYEIHVGMQKKPLDVTGYTNVKDCLEFKNQINKYTYTAPSDGQYRFEINEIHKKNGAGDVVLEIYDDLGDQVKRDCVTNGQGLTIADLEEGETYTIYVEYIDILETYELDIFPPKNIKDITQYDIVNDSIEYIDQDNIYEFVPEDEGYYSFSIEELNADITVGMTVYNRLGEELDYISNCENGDYIELDLNEGETYQVHITQSEGTGTYSLNVYK